MARRIPDPADDEIGQVLFFLGVAVFLTLVTILYIIKGYCP